MKFDFINLPEHIKYVKQNMQNVALENLLNSIKHMHFVHTALKKTFLTVYCLNQFCVGKK